MKILIMAACTVLSAVSCGARQEGGQGMDGAVRAISTGASNMYLVRGNDGYAVVDTGMGWTGEKFSAAFAKFGIAPGDIKLIVLTHSHTDHTGGLAALKKLTGAPVLCHENAAVYLAEGKSSPAVARNALGKLLNALLPELKREPFVPDITFDRSYDLSRFGIHGKAIHSPGHSSDSITIALETGETIIGDQFRGKAGSLTLGMFCQDEPLALESLKTVEGFGSRVLYMSHGKFTDNKDLATFITSLDRKRS